ncbi:MAG: hypothetical protein HOC91_13900 [Nitrospinaceae bacterium]|jgi:hypothetical protein|nr:hypothetical protein [Nitrospinaceae bacterium]MBT3433186.1 hypothetical protein [Nitrospinaceae bacterium]MBT3822215.1 hypothetical protein [Nitrospinaceae bacterium]MBT4093895.1 hypothetical protein [Nitrospinaceae bacterium]MBT4431598.1 hypothetical protein [Nitrospinaceae bacterium]
MTLLSMQFRQKITRLFLVMFMLGALLGFARELVLAQWVVDDFGKDLSGGVVPSLLKAGRNKNEIGEHLERGRLALGFERVELYGPKGHLVVSSPTGGHGVGEDEIHGLLTSTRTGIRTSTGELAHIVVWRNMESEVARPLLFGLIMALITSLIAWPIISRKIIEGQST